MGLPVSNLWYFIIILRFFQRLLEESVKSVVVYDSDMLDSTISVANGTHLNIYSFDSKAGLYIVYQSIRVPYPCAKLFSFTLAYQHYLGCVPAPTEYGTFEPVLFVFFDYNKNEYILAEDNFWNITAVDAYPVAVADYRDEYFLIVIDPDGALSIMSYHGRQVGYKVEYTCNTETGRNSCLQNSTIKDNFLHE
jgi:hypothetical protein